MFTGNENHSISLQDAADLTANYRNQFGEDEAYIKGEYFGKSALQSVLNQNDCIGIRIYYGLDSNNVPKLVIVGVTENGNDLENGELMEFGLPCPTYCSVANDLNS